MSISARIASVGLMMLIGVGLVHGPAESWGVRLVSSALADESDESAQKPTSIPNRVTERHIKAYSGLIALLGIVIAGVGLGALTIVWGGRLRRQLRRPLPECESPSRDFWFLKPPKPKVTDSGLPDWHQPPHEDPPDPTEQP